MILMQNATSQKLRGGFYTPKPIASFMLKWATNGNCNYDILEPSCGDGVFLEQIKNNWFEYNSMTAIELDENEAKKASGLAWQTCKKNLDLFLQRKWINHIKKRNMDYWKAILPIEAGK